MNISLLISKYQYYKNDKLKNIFIQNCLKKKRK